MNDRGYIGQCNNNKRYPKNKEGKQECIAMISKGRESFHPGKWTYVCSNALRWGESTARYSSLSFFNETR